VCDAASATVRRATLSQRREGETERHYLMGNAGDKCTGKREGVKHGGRVSRKGASPRVKYQAKGRVTLKDGRE